VLDRPLVVVGLMATGKSTIAHALGTRLGLPVHDSDDDIGAETGRTVRQLTQDEGPATMHEREARQLLDVLADGSPCIAAAAASVIDDERCREALSRVPVVWLRATVATMVSRFSAQSHRPTFGLAPEELLRRQLATRGPRFAAVADVVVDVDGSAGPRAPEDIVEEILRRLPDPGGATYTPGRRGEEDLGGPSGRGGDG
jgi:shikimate kinase